MAASDNVGGTVEQWLEVLPHGKKAAGSTPSLKRIGHMDHHLVNCVPICLFNVFRDLMKIFYVTQGYSPQAKTLRPD